MTAIQYTDTAKSADEARQMLAFLASQVDYLGGRITEPAGRGWWETFGIEPLAPVWKVQAFFEDVPESTWLPDGCRRVLVLPSMTRLLGVAA